MRHNDHIKEFKFCHEPIEFNKKTKKEILQYCLGAILYMPGTKEILGKIINKDISELKSMVMCLEDAIDLKDLKKGEENILHHLHELSEAIHSNEITIDDLPLIFVRVRGVDQFKRFVEKLSQKHAEVLSGFVFPKFHSDNAETYLKELKRLNDKYNSVLYGMPILEGDLIAFAETRIEELKKIKEVIDPFQELILNIRIGGTDMSSLFGVRRGINTSVYDILPVRDTISDILNFFARTSDNYIISAPVWEYFLAYADDDLSKYLGEDIHRSLLSQETIVNDAIDGLLREVLRDKSNGMVGKTVIHPSHLRFVNAMQAITLEEFDDANQIIQASGGVLKSYEGNKMNEIGPHRSWAERTILRAKAFGVIKSEKDYLKLFKN